MTTVSLPQLPEWRVKSKSSRMVASATQIETHAACRRKWWLDNVRKLPVLQKTPQTFGDALHGVCERYLKADDLGRDASGNSVELFPKDWHIVRSRYDGKPSGTITPIEQDLIRKLIAKAIDEGILERQPGREIEKQFWLPVLEKEAEGVSVQLTGFIDVRYRDRVEDHKTTSSMRWAKSPAALKKSPQMMIYAKVLIEAWKQKGEPPAREIVLRHNVYCKDPDDMRVRKVEATVTPSEVETYWEGTILPAIHDMLTLRQNTEKWNQIQDPPDMPEPCNAYGGCPFRSICGGAETEENYVARIDKALKTRYPVVSDAEVTAVIENPQQTHTKGSDMASPFAAKIAQRAAANTAAAAGQPPVSVNSPGAAPASPPAAGKISIFNRNPAATPPSNVTAAASPPTSAVSGHPTPSQQSPQTSKSDAPPWASADCRGCKGTGFNSAGDPCRVCVLKAKQAGRPLPDQFEIVLPGDGTAQWVKLDGTIDGVTQFAAPASEVVASEKVEAPKPAPPPAPVPMMITS